MHKIIIIKIDMFSWCRNIVEDPHTLLQIHEIPKREYMRALLDQLHAKGKIYKKLVEVQPKELGIRNKIRIFSATDTL